MAKQLNVNLAFTADTSQARMQIQNLQTQLTSLINQPVGLGQQLTADIQSATTAAAELKVHLQNATNVKTGSLDFGKLNQSLKASGVTLSQYAAKLQSLGPAGQQAFMSLARSVAQAEVPIRRSNALLTQMGTTLMNTARWQLSSSILHGFMGAIQKAYGYSKDLNESLNNIRIVTGYNIEQMSKFAAEANKAAKALSTTTTEYTNASLIYYQQGLDDAAVKARADVTIKLANVSRQSAEIVSDQMTAIWNNFYDGSRSLEYYADVVTALGAATASSSEEIATGLEKFAAVAETVGLSYEYATAALATVTATTRQSADVVGTAFKTLFARIQDLDLGKTLDDGTTLGSYSQALMKVGINIKDTNGSLKDMDVILNEMGAKWSKLSDDQQVALAKSVAGVRQYTQLIALMENWDFMQSNLETVHKSTGELNKQAKIYAESWEAASNRVRASLETIYASVMDDEFFIDLTNGFGFLIERVGGFVKSIGGLQGVLSGLGMILIRVFNEQLTEGFRNLAYNIQMSTVAGQKAIQQAKAAEMQKMSSMMVNSETSGVYDSQVHKAYARELQMQSELIENSHKLTASEKEKYQILLDQQQAYNKQIIDLAQQVELSQEMAANAQTSIMGTGLMQGMDFEKLNTQMTKFRINAKGLGEVEYQLKAIASGGKVTDAQIKALTESLRKTGMGAEQARKLANSFAGVRGNSEDARVAISRVSAELFKQKGAIKDQVAQMLGLEKGTAEYRALSAEIDNFINHTEQATLKTKHLDAANKQAVSSMKAFSEMLKEAGINTQDWANKMTTVMSSIMSLGMLISSINGLIDTIKDPDMSGWEKFASILTSIGMITMMTTSVFKGLFATIELVKIAKEKHAVATTINALAMSIENKEAERANRKKTAEIVLDKIRSVFKKKEIADHGKDVVATGAEAAAQDKLNKEKAEEIALDAIRQKQGLSTGTYKSGKRAGQTWYKQNGKFITQDKYNSLMQSGGSSGGGKTSLINSGAFKTIGKAVGRFAAAAAAIAIVAGTIHLATESYNKHNKAAKEAAERATEAATAFNKVQESYNTFNDTVSAYKEAKDGLASLTKGTVEYQAAIIEANKSAMELLKTHKELQYTVNADGLIEINEASLRQAQQIELGRLKNAQQAQLVAQADATQAQAQAKSVDFQRDKLSSNNASDTGETFGNAAIAGGAGAAAGALGAVALGLASGPVGWAALIVGAVAAVVGGIVTATVGRANTEEEDALNKLATIYENEGNARFAADIKFEEMLREDIGLEDEKLIATLVANREATAELAAEMSLANIQARNANASVIKDEYGTELQRKYGFDEAEAQQVAGIASAKLDQLTEELYDEEYEDQWFGKTDADIQKQYAAAMGWATDTIDNQSGNKAKYYDKEGNEIGVISDETARRYLAQQAALKKLQPTLEQVAVKFKELSTSVDIADNGLANFIKDQNFYGVSQNQYNAMRQEIAGENGQIDEGEIEQYLVNNFAENGKYLTEEDALAAGYNSVDEFITDFTNNFTKYSESRQDIFKDLSPDIKSAMSQLNLDQFSTTAVDMIGDSLTAAMTSLEGEEAVEQLMNVYKKAGDEAGLLAEGLTGIDWSNATPDVLIDKFNELGITTEFTAEELDLLIATMSAGVIDIASKTKLLDEMSQLQQGGTISLEQYSQLSASAQSYFQQMSDGTMKLIGDAAEFYDLVMGEKRDLLSREQQLNIKDLDESITYIKGQMSPIQQAKQVKGWTLEERDIFDQYLESKFGAGQYGIDDYTAYTGNYGIEHNMVMGGNRELSFMTAEGDWRADISNDDSYNTTTGEYGWYDGRDSSRTTQAFQNEEEFFNYYIGNSASGNNEWKQKYTDFENHIGDMLDLLEESEYWVDSGDNADLLEGWQDTFANGTYAQVYAMYDEVLNAVQVQLPEKQAELENKIEELNKEVTANTFQVLSTYKNATEREAAYLEQMADFSIDNQEVRNAITEGYMQAQGAAIEEEAMRGLDVEEVKEYGDYLEELFDFEDEANDADDLAKVILKLNRGLESLTSNFADWGTAIARVTEGNRNAVRATEEYREAFMGTRDAIADILDVSTDFIDMDFVESNLGTIEKIANGDKEAIQELGFEFARTLALAQTESMTFDHLNKLGMNAEEAAEHISNLQTKVEELAKMEMPNLEIGSPVSDEFFAAMRAVVDAAGMTAEEANSYYRSMGFTPVYEETEVPAAQGTVTLKTIQGHRVGDDENYTIYETVTEEEVPIGDAAASLPELKIKTADGKEVKASEAVANGKTVKSKGAKPSRLIYNGGGSLGNTTKPKTGGGGGSKKEKKKLEEEKERYYEINQELSTLANKLDRIAAAKERAFGKAKSDLIKQEIAVIDEEIAATEQLLDEIAQYAEQDMANLAAFGFTFNEDNNITNYDEIMAKEIEAYNAAMDSGDEGAIAAAEERWKLLEDYLTKYEGTMDKWDETVLKQMQEKNKKYEKLFEDLTYTIEVDLNLEEDQIKLLDHLLTLLEDKAFSAAEAIALLGDKTQSVLNQSAIYANGITELLNLHGINPDTLNGLMDGSISINDIQDEYGFSDEDASKLREYINGLMEANTSLIELRNTVQEKVMVTFQEWNEEMDKGISKIAHLSEVIDAYQNLVDLVGKATLGLDGDFMQKIASARTNNAKNALVASQAQWKASLEAYNAAEREYNAAVERNDKDAMEYWKDRMDELQVESDNYYSAMQESWANALQAAQEEFEITVQETVDAYEKAMAGTFGSLDALQQAFDQQNEVLDRYVTDYTKIYELSKLNRDIVNSIDETDNIKAKRELRDLQEEITALQESDAQMSQYDLDYLRAKYELRLAEIALEEAQNAKSQVRMRRDSEGNYSYVFTADESEVATSSQNYEDKLYAMQQLNSEYIREVQNNILQSEIELANALRDLDRSKFASDEEYYAEVNRLTEYYTGQRNFYLDELNKSLNNNAEVYAQDWTRYSMLTGYKLSADEQYLDKFTETVYAQITGYESIAEAQVVFTEATSVMVQDLHEAFETWQLHVKDVMEKAGTSIETFGTDTERVLNNISTQSAQSAADVTQSASEFTTAFGTICTAVSEWQTQYNTSINSAIESNVSMMTSCNSLMNMLSNVGGGISTTSQQFTAAAAAIEAAAARIAAAAAAAASAAGGVSNLQVPSTTGDGTKTMKQNGIFFGSVSVGGTAQTRTVDGVSYVAAGGGWIKISDLDFHKRGITITSSGNGRTTYYVDQYYPITKYKLESLDTGGYTGAWGPSGRLALLHQKELVLNAQDTENMLNAINIIRDIARVIDLNAASSANAFTLMNSIHSTNGGQTIEQEVTIHAEFPNATNHSEIEEAFNTLINQAAQFANRKN